MPDNQAIVAIARKLLVALWHVLTEKAADKHAEPQMVATKLMRWSWKLTDEEHGGMTSRQFIRYHLMRLGLGEDLTHVTYGNMSRRIASVEELQAARPDLQPTTDGWRLTPDSRRRIIGAPPTERREPVAFSRWPRLFISASLPRQRVLAAGRICVLPPKAPIDFKRPS